MIPDRKSKLLSIRLRKAESRNVTYISDKFPIFWESAKGTSVRDVDGHTYLDLTAAFGVSTLGHRNSRVASALKRQSTKLWHGMGDVHPSRIKVELLERLAKITPGNLQKSILSSSGAEAVESALKTARFATGRAGVLAFEGGYHGLTYGALTATHAPMFSEPFWDQLAPMVVHAPYPDSLRGPDEETALRQTAAILKRLRGKIGAILIEPVQGRGGIRIPAPGFLPALQKLARREGAVFIVDEIYTGFGRTGRPFAVEHSGIVPDLMCVGKALANGYPISACIGRSKIMDAWPESDGEAIHTSTFLGNPLGCAMALAAIDEMQRLDVVNRAATLGKWWLHQLKAALSGHPRVGEIRGIGLMLGIELVHDRHKMEPNPRLAGKVVIEALKQGLILLSGGSFRNVVTLTPPLTISKSELTEATQKIATILS
jgi:4-aminobutyrate aminotransferase